MVGEQRKKFGVKGKQEKSNKQSVENEKALAGGLFFYTISTSASSFFSSF